VRLGRALGLVGMILALGARGREFDSRSAPCREGIYDGDVFPAPRTFSS
jgi:hypothetical protein